MSGKPLRLRPYFFLALAFIAAACNAQGVVTINEPWARVAPDGRSAQAYMRVTSSEGAALVSARSLAATHVLIVGPGHPGGITELDLPAHERVDLARGHYRIRLEGLKGDVSLGARIPLVLAFRGSNGSLLEVAADAEVRLHSPTEDESRPHHSHAQHHAH
jgi:copper(I)-binding protein